MNTDPRLLNGLATVSAGYIKRWLEINVYDSVASTDFGKKLISLDKEWKYGIELGLNVVTALLDWVQPGDSYLLNMLKQVGMDLAPEVSSRLIYGSGELKRDKGMAREDKEPVQVLGELRGEVLAELLTWLHGLDPGRKARILAFLSRMSKEGVAEISKLKSPLKEYLIELLDTIEQTEDSKANG